MLAGSTSTPERPLGSDVTRLDYGGAKQGGEPVEGLLVQNGKLASQCLQKCRDIRPMELGEPAPRLERAR